jgi:hypothetical protein
MGVLNEKSNVTLCIENAQRCKWDGYSHPKTSLIDLSVTLSLKTEPPKAVLNLQGFTFFTL